MRQNKHTGHQEVKEIVYFLLAAALCSSVSKKIPCSPENASQCCYHIFFGIQ